MSAVLDDDDRDGRTYPARPVVGVGAVVVHDGAVLLVQRGCEPARGEWSLPGGALHLGETLSDGVAREVWEETGLTVTPRTMLGTLDRIVHDDAGGVRFHYVLVDWVCDLAGEKAVPVAGDDALAAAWVPLQEIGRGAFQLSDTAVAMVARAASSSGARGASGA